MHLEWKDLVFVLLIVLSAFLTVGTFSMNIRLDWWEKQKTLPSSDDAKEHSSQDMYNWIGIATLVVLVLYFGWLLWTQVFGSETRANIKKMIPKL
jgi:hypothetical protein